MPADASGQGEGEGWSDRGIQLIVSQNQSVTLLAKLAKTPLKLGRAPVLAIEPLSANRCDDVLKLLDVIDKPIEFFLGDLFAYRTMEKVSFSCLPSSET